MGYEWLLLLPVVFFSAMFCIHNSKKLRSKLIFLVAEVAFYFFFFFVYPSPVAVSIYPPRVWWRGPTDNLMADRRLSDSWRRIKSSVGIQVVNGDDWNGGAWAPYADRRDD